MFRQSELVNEMDGLKKFAWRLTGNEPDADDLVQETVLKALEKNHQFQQGTDLFRWTSKIMFHQFASDYRRQTKFESQYDPEPYINKVQIPPVQEEKVIFEEVGEALSSLSYKHRQILYMICIDGMKYKIAAQKLHIPVGTVRSRLSRARMELQKQIDSPTETKWARHKKTA